MSIFYADNEPPFTGKPIPYNEMPATKFYLSHFNNMLILQAMQLNPKDFQEKLQVTKEIGICQRKLDHWKKHPNYDQDLVTEECARLKALWKRGA